METLTDLQHRVYAALRADGTSCFLHLSRSSDALWTTDLPQRAAPDAAEEAQRRLKVLGFDIHYTQPSALWHIAPDERALSALLPEGPQPLPPFPQNDELLTLYQLCRILLAHPASLSVQPRRELYTILKHSGSLYDLQMQAPVLLRSAAVSLRQGLPLAYHGGLLIARMLNPTNQPNGDD